MTTVVLVRHGRTAANTSGTLAGRMPGVELDEVGAQQVREVGTRLAEVPLVGVVTSPLRRCRQTAHALVAARATALPVSIEQGLVECGYGEWTGKSLKELSKDRLWTAVQTQPSAVRFPGGESMSEMAARASNAIRSWNARFAARDGPSGVWAAVSHGDVIKAILADALGMHLDSFQRILVDPGSISIVSYTEHRPYVVTVNSTNADLGHLFSHPPKKSRRRAPGKENQASVGGGLGASEQLGGPEGGR
jgi:probable phosphomutase (TIGR03848 family)